jgi:thiosulfate reductase/polysulfide reductase chain A
MRHPDTDPLQSTITRRRFLEIGGAGAATLALGGLVEFAPRLTDAAVPPSPSDIEGIATTCGLCVNKCGVMARVRDGVVHKLDPIPDHPKSRGMLCARGNAGVKVLYDPDRLKTPLIRSGPRGSGQWRVATWDEALDHVARELDAIRTEFGPEAVLFSSTEGFQEHFFRLFAQAWGSPNVVRHPTLCLASMINGMFNTFGTVPDFDVKNTRYVILAGANRFEALVTPDSVDLGRNLGSGMKLVVLDPRFNVTAAKADEWFPVRPGTDLAFVLGMMHVIVAEGLQDQEFIDRYTVGFDELREHLRVHTPEWAASECGVEATAIRRIAREFAAAAPRAIFYPGRRSSWNENDTQFRRGIAVLNALVGAWDRPGACIPKAGLFVDEPDVFPPDDVLTDRCDDLASRFPLANRNDGTYLSLRDAILEAKESPVQAWMIYKQNPLQSVPDSNRTLRMMERMRLIVSIDTAPSDTAWMSDVILPESVYLERTDPPHAISGAVPVLALRQQVVPPRHDTRPCLDIMKGLAARLGSEEYFDFTVDDWVEAAVRRLPIGLEEFRRKGFYTDRSEPVVGKTLAEGFRFRTVSGKIELASERFRERGYPAVPTYRPPSAVPQGQYRLLTGRSALYTHSSLQNVSWLADVDPTGAGVWIHPATAARHGLRDGDPVGLRSPAGEARGHARVTRQIRPDCVFVPHGFGSRSTALSESARRGVRDSDLIGNHRDEITGNAAMHETSVELFPVPGERLRRPVPPSTRTTEEVMS